MKILIFLFVYLMSSQFLIAQNKEFSSSCLSDFKSVFNHNVGDVFQYKQTIADGSGGGEQFQIRIAKYQIVDKESEDDTIIYRINGVIRTHWEESGYPYPYGVNVKTLNSTLVYIDSSNHILNYCADTALVNKDEGYYALVTDFINGDTTGKHIGGQGNLFTKNDGGLLEPLECNHFEEKYASGLGLLLHFESMCFEYWSKEVLEGYIKGGDTLGIITPDKELWVGLEPNDGNTRVIVYPNPAKNRLYMNNLDNFGDHIIRLYSAEGKLLLMSNIIDNSLDVSWLKTGLYYYQVLIDHSNKVINGRFIKQ